MMTITPHTIDTVVATPYTTLTSRSSPEADMAFVRRRGNAYYLVHNVRRRGKIQQLHLAKLGERPRITEDVVRQVSRNHPLLDLDWRRLREEVNNRVQLFDPRSPYVQNLVESMRNLNLDLAELSPPMVTVAEQARSSRELMMQLRLLRTTVDIKIKQFAEAYPRSLEGGRKLR